MGRAFFNFCLYIQNTNLGGVNVTSIRDLYLDWFQVVKCDRVVSAY